MSPSDPPNAVAALAALPNLGPKSAVMLMQAGIADMHHLRALGAVAAYRRVKSSTPSASLNLLWALEGALTQTPWQVVARERRADLLLALDALQQSAP